MGGLALERMPHMPHMISFVPQITAWLRNELCLFWREAQHITAPVCPRHLDLRDNPLSQSLSALKLKFWDLGGLLLATQSKTKLWLAEFCTVFLIWAGLAFYPFAESLPTWTKMTKHHSVTICHNHKASLWWMEHVTDQSGACHKPKRIKEDQREALVLQDLGSSVKLCKLRHASRQRFSRQGTYLGKASDDIERGTRRLLTLLRPWRLLRILRLLNIL